MSIMYGNIYMSSLIGNVPSLHVTLPVMQDIDSGLYIYIYILLYTVYIYIYTVYKLDI